MKRTLRQRLICALAVFVCVLFALPFFGNANLNLYTASADDGYIKIQAYEVEMTIQEDRQVRVEEKITVEFLQNRRMFYRAFPIETARFYDLTVNSNDPSFDYYVKDNEDVEGFFDVNITGDTTRGKVWTYEIEFTMENGLGAASSNNGMIIDVVPFGSSAPYHNVKATVHFPYEVELKNCVLYKGLGSTVSAGDLNKQLSADGKTLTFSTDYLGVEYTSDYGRVVKGVTLDFTMNGEFKSYFITRAFTDATWWLVLAGVCIVGVALFIRIRTRTPRELVTVVNVTAPDEMDPMTMGTTLDGMTDSEDITSMIYYFAHRGWLTIDLTDEADPVLTRKVAALPDSACAHEKTLFDGLFISGESVAVSELKYNFYQYADRAKIHVKRVKMYEKKSVLGYVFGGVLALGYAVLAFFILGATRLNGYSFLLGVAAFVPVVIHLLFGALVENYRYKWKKGKRALLYGIIIATEIIFTIIFVFALGTHIATEFEKLYILLASYACLYCVTGVLSRCESYLKTLGQVIGFKDFIVFTEEDRIRFMLEEDPQLYYKILPYAQVLGVTDEWEGKFANILIDPPYWCYGSNASTFDYIVFNRTMSRAMHTAMQRPDSNGGVSGAGGGSFGSGGGGGFGGGGFGSR